MGDVLVFKKSLGKEKAKLKAKGKTLCSSGFHKWQIENDKQFDVKQGCLVTAWRCVRCGERKVKST